MVGLSTVSLGGKMKISLMGLNALTTVKISGKREKIPNPASSTNSTI